VIVLLVVPSFDREPSFILERHRRILANGKIIWGLFRSRFLFANDEVVVFVNPLPPVEHGPTSIRSREVPHA
jgi:hypothetical protein